MKIKTNAALSDVQKRAIEKQLIKKGFHSSSVRVVDGKVQHMHNIVHLRCEQRAGRGYSGGHRTAERKGWRTWTPSPSPNADATLAMESSGRFTGYRPYRMDFFVEELERPFEDVLFETDTWISSEDERLKALYEKYPI